MKLRKKYILDTFFSIFVSTFSMLLLNIFFKNITFLFSFEISLIIFIVLEIFLIYEDRFSPLLFIFISFGIGILDVILVGLNIRLIPNKHSMAIYEKSLEVIILWLLFFMIGYFITRKKKTKTLLKQNQNSNKMNNNIFLIIYTILYLFVVFRIMTTFIKIGGINSSMVNSAIFRYNNQVYLATLLSLSSIIPICLIEKGKNKLSIIIILIMLIILIITGRRGLIINYLIIPIITYINYKKKKITNKLGILFAIFSISLILIIGGARGQKSISSNNNYFVKSLTNLTISTKLGENLPDTIYSLNNNFVNHCRFKYFFRGIVGLVPRAIWKNKPELIDHSMIISSDIYNIKTYGRPVGAFGYSYYCFGMYGVIIIGLLSGFITKKFYNWMLNKNDYIHTFIYSLLIINIINVVKPECQLTIISLMILIVSSIIISTILNKSNYIFKKGE